MPYTDAELSQAVTNIVRDAIRYDYDALGIRKIGTSFNDLQDAAAGLFISRNGAAFFVVRLARDRLLEVCTATREAIGVLQRYVKAVGRSVSPVTRTRSLNNARVALDALAQATAQRTGTYQNIENIPAFLRFDRNAQKFLSEEGRKVRSGGDVIEPPEQARSLIRSALRDLRNQYDEMLRKTELLKNSIPSYSALNLPARLSATVMENASSVLQRRIEELDALDPKGRLGILREVVLDVLAAKSTVKGFGSLEPPTTFLLLEGTGGLYADDLHPAVPAELVAEKDGGYIIWTDLRWLGFEVDSMYQVNYPPPGSFRGAFDLVGLWPRRLEYGGAFNLVVSDESASASYPITLSSPVTYQAYTFVDQVNTQLGANTSVVEALMEFVTPYTTVEVDIAFTAGFSADFSADPSVDFGALGVQPGDLLVINDPSSSMYRSNWVVSSVAGNVINAFNTLGFTPTIENDIQIRVGPVGSEYPVIRLTDFALAVELRRDLSIVDVDEGTVIQLGMASGARSRSSRTLAQSVAADFNVQPYSLAVGAPRMEADFVFREDSFVGTTQCHSHPEDPNAISMYFYKGEAEVVLDGSSMQLRLLDELPDASLLNNVDKAVIVRAAPTSDDVGNTGVVTGVSGDIIDVNVVNTWQGAIGDIVEIELGWDYWTMHGQFRHDGYIVVDPANIDGPNVFQVIDTAFNSVTGQKYPFQVTVDPGVLGYAQLGNQPRFFEGTLGRYAAVFRSLDETLASKLSAAPTNPGGSPPLPPAHSEFFVSSPAEAVAMTEWVQLPEVPARLEAGDVLEVHLTSPSTPDLVATILNVEADNRLIRIDQFVAADFASSLNFSTSSPPPFARIRKTVMQNFSDLEAALEVWLSLPKNDTLFTFRQLDSAVNAVLVNKNPTQSQTGTVMSLLLQLDATVSSLEEDLLIYEAATVEEVGTLISSFRQKGCDRAVDVLLEGDFNTFFGLDVNDASYAGALQKTIRDVQRADLPVRRDNRNDFQEVYDAVHVATFEDYDPELITDEGDPLERLDIPELNDVLPGIPVP